MFDANMRYLPVGRRFFAEVHYCDQGILYNAGARMGDLLLCEMLDESNNNPKVAIEVKGKTIYVYSDSDFEEKLLVFGGNEDLTSFIDDNSLEQAKEMVKENNYEQLQ